VADLGSRRRARSHRAAWVASAAAAVLLVIAGAVLVGVRIGGDDGGGGGEVASVEELVRQAASQPGSRTAELTTTDGVVAATVVVDEEGHAFVRADAMPGTDAEHTYQLWSVDGGTPVSLGLLGPDPTTAMVGVDGHVHQLAVTLEPAGGSAGPTTTPMASGTLSA
jgi:anti-sigma-K factor RskA